MIHLLKKALVTALIFSLSIGTCFSQPNTSAVIFMDALPVCVNDASAIAEMQNVQKANSKTASKYDGYRKLLNNDNDLELATRLAYAETLAANCPQQTESILELVTSAIGNRIRLRQGNVQSVTFQRDQFASSLNIYPESRYRDFLCPGDGTLWKKAITQMRKNLESQKPIASIPLDTVNYYLYRHSDRFQAPDWKLAEVMITDEKTRDCIRVFRNPAWK